MSRNLTMNLFKIFFLMAILSLTLCGVGVYCLYQKAYDANANIITTYQTIRIANRSLLAIDDAAIDVSSFLISKDFESLKRIPVIVNSLQLNISTLQQLVNDNANEQQIFAKLKAIIDKKIQYLLKLFSLYSSGNKNAALNLASDKDRLELTNNIHQMMILIKQLESGQLEQALPTYLLYKNDADRFLILAGTINIFWFLLIYLYARRYLDRA